MTAEPPSAEAGDRGDPGDEGGPGDRADRAGAADRPGGEGSGAARRAGDRLAIPETLRAAGEHEQRLRGRYHKPERSPEMRALGIGLEFAGAVGGGCVFGYAFDLWRGTFPTGTVVGAALGIVTGGYHTAKAALRVSRELEAFEQRRRQERQEQLGGGEPRRPGDRGGGGGMG